MTPLLQGYVSLEHTRYLTGLEFCVHGKLIFKMKFVLAMTPSELMAFV
jgi:hypothetical protein